jgi:DNA mismatch repair ATPase MutS
LKQAAEVIPLSAHMKSMSTRAEIIEEEVFQSELLEEEKSSLFAGQSPASVQLKELDRLGLWVQNRLNLLYLPINLLLWTDFILYHRLAKWKTKVGISLLQLPETLENWEVWVSLGAFEQEVGFLGKSIWSEDRILGATNAKHPLIHPEKAIGNSIQLGQDAQLALLTGANMSGKTTFMRTLGINAVLVNLGLRPFADEFTLGPIQLYTSMRNSDNLGESVSSFYAELFRIRSLITRLEAGEKVFFMLDEILKGTNTQDRISGSQALIHQVLQTKGFGLISTHDIELAELAEKEARLRNFSFHSEIQDQTIKFDYKLKEGPCPSFNAHKLMELMGIRFEKD